MLKANTNFEKLSKNYLFSEVARRQREYLAKHPDADIIRISIGDVTQPLPQVCIDAMHQAVDEMADAKTFQGYPPEIGFAFLREAIAQHDYAGLNITADEVVVSDGAKSDTANFTDILGDDNIILLTDPVYPVYMDSNIIAGRKDQIRMLPCTQENDFKPTPPDFAADVIYLCSPNNPTGSALTRDELKAWVDYARKHNAVILFDGAYEAFIRHQDVPRSIYEIEGAHEVAVEFRSFSKTAGFTGTRCAYTVIPKTVKAQSSQGPVSLLDLWVRRQSTKFNGAPYIVQRAAAAIYTPEGQQQVRQRIDLYLNNAAVIRSGFEALGLTAFGADNSPYVWIKVPEGYDSWSFFDFLLDRCHVVGTPGVGFGTAGEGYLRLTGFGDPQRTREAMARITKALSK